VQFVWIEVRRQPQQINRGVSFIVLAPEVIEVVVLNFFSKLMPNGLFCMALCFEVYSKVNAPEATNPIPRHDYPKIVVVDRNSCN
jgi:hypothetical protein